MPLSQRERGTLPTTPTRPRTMLSSLSSSDLFGVHHGLTTANPDCSPDDKGGCEGDDYDGGTANYRFLSKKACCSKPFSELVQVRVGEPAGTGHVLVGIRRETSNLCAADLDLDQQLTPSQDLRFPDASLDSLLSSTACTALRIRTCCALSAAQDAGMRMAFPRFCIQPVCGRFQVKHAASCAPCFSFFAGLEFARDF